MSDYYQEDGSEGQEQPQPEVRYFLPGKVVFLVEHNTEILGRSLPVGLAKDPLIAEHGAVVEALNTGIARVTTFQDDRQAAFSLLSVDVPLNDAELIALVDDIDKALYGQYDEDTKQAPLDDREEPDYEGPTQENVEGVVLRGLAPDWLFTSTPYYDPGQGGTGGPGAYPVPVKFVDSSWYGCTVDDPAAPFAFRLPKDLTAAGENPVEVAILDSVPSLCDLERAYRYWHEEHPLIDSLFGENGQFQIPNDRLSITYADPELMDPLNKPGSGPGLLGYGYTLTDHGTFVAGVVHSIACQAKLHLIQVLNDYGVGSLSTIAAGLEKLKARRRDEDGPLVINMSLMLNMPRDADGHAWDGLTWDRLSSRAFQRRMGRFVRWMLDILRGQDALVVAAAGNDGKANTPPPAPRYPAAFKDVIGVGALNKDYQQNGDEYIVFRAVYSNFADDPGYDGFVTFGGDAGPDGTTDPDKGMLGLYIGDFPNGSLCENGWARWAGTSFATPVVAGVLARLEGAGHPDPVQILRDLITERLTDNEQLLIVEQG